MTAYNWPRYLEYKSTNELVELIENNPENFEDEAIFTAKRILETRPRQLIQNNEFPPKPTIEEKKNSINKSIISLISFVVLFMIFFRWEFKFIAILVLVILIHEIGHYAAMRLYKFRDLSIFFIPLIGAFAKGEKEDITQRQNVIISLSGPIPGILIGCLLMYYAIDSSNDFLTRVANLFIFINIFNLIPIMPLDGGRIIKALFIENNLKINIVFHWISIAALCFIALSSESYFLLVIPLLLYNQLRFQSQIISLRKNLYDKDISLNKNYSDLTDREYWLIRDEIAQNIKGFDRLIDKKRYVAVPAEKRVINTVKQIIEKRPIKDLKFIGKSLILLTWLLFLIVPYLYVLVLQVVYGLI